MQQATWCLIPALAFGLAWGDDHRYIEFPHSLPGVILKVRKEVNQQTGRMVLVSNHPSVADEAAIRALEISEDAAVRLETGNLHAPLAKKVAMMDLAEILRVCLRVKSEPHSYLDKTSYSEEVLRQNAKAALEVDQVEEPQAVAARYGLSAMELRGRDIVVVNADKVRLQAMKQDANIASIWEDVTESRISQSNFPIIAESAYMDNVPTTGGSGVKSGTFEDGLTSTFLSCIGKSATYDAFISSDEDAKRHSQASFRALVAAAPGATFYHRRSDNFGGTNDVSYIVDNAIQTLSMSLAKGGTTPYSATYSEFLTMDNMAYNYPYPVFVNPAANAGYTYAVNWQGYNAVSVGNVRHTSRSNYELAECTQTKNPPPRYGSCISGSGSNCAGDREMPHIVVPGIPDTGTTFSTSCLEGTGTVSCGTSWSAPIGSGMAAQVIAADSRMVSWPEKVRATLILTAQNVESGHWDKDGDERDGTGTISGKEAVAFASGHTSVSPGNTACEKGMGAASFYAADFSGTKRFNFLVPNPKPSGKHLRVVLTWDSNPNVNNGTNDLSDLDLVVQKNGGTQSSSSWDSNVEVVDVAAADLTAGSSYYIDISPYSNRIPSGLYFYYAIAWAWVTDEAP